MIQVRGQATQPQRLPPRAHQGIGSGWGPTSSSRSPSSQYERPTLVSPSVSEFSEDAVESVSIRTSERIDRHQYAYDPVPKLNQQAQNGVGEQQHPSFPLGATSNRHPQFGGDEGLVFGSAADHLTYLSRELFDVHREALDTLREALYQSTSPLQDQGRGYSLQSSSSPSAKGNGRGGAPRIEDAWIAVIEDRVLSQYLDYTMSLQQRLVAAESERLQLQEALSLRAKSNERLTKRVSELEELLLRRHSELSTTPLGTRGMNGGGGFQAAYPSSAARPPKQPVAEVSTPDANQRLLQFLRVVERSKGAASDKSPSSPALRLEEGEGSAATTQNFSVQPSAAPTATETNGRPPLNGSTPSQRPGGNLSPPSGNSFHEELRLLRLELQQANGDTERPVGSWYS